MVERSYIIFKMCRDITMPTLIPAPKYKVGDIVRYAFFKEGITDGAEYGYVADIKPNIYRERLMYKDNRMIYYIRWFDNDKEHDGWLGEKGLKKC